MSGKRHSTGDASAVAGWIPQVVVPMQSTMSLESESRLKKTEVTDI